MQQAINYFDFVPQLVPQKMNGTLTYNIRIKKDYKRNDKTNALYLDIYQPKLGRKKLNLKLWVPKSAFNERTQRLKSSYKYASDYNLLIEKLLADINAIEVSYRLMDSELTIDKLLEDLTTPSLRIDFNAFYSNMLEYQKNEKIIKETTYKQQKATLSKIKQFKDPWLFADITPEKFREFRAFLKNDLKNKPATVEIATKNFKKYLGVANGKRIKTELLAEDIQVKDVEGTITFLLPEEVKKLYSFYNSVFINDTWKAILQRYLFSCFTGLRISDVEKIKPENFVDGTLVFVAQKTEKLQRIKLNKVALELVEFPQIFNGEYAQQTINQELKKIAKACNINKRLYFHSARHTFATNYLIAGGQVHNLQKLLGHSKIETTMKYVHVVATLMDKEIGYLESIVD